MPDAESVPFEAAPPSRSPIPRLKAVAAAVAVVVVAVVAVVAFGGSGGTVGDPVAQAATVSATAPGYQIRLSMTMHSPAIPTPITASGSGTFDGRSRSGSVTIALNLGSDPQVTRALGSSTLDLREILNGTTVYMKLPAAAMSTLPLGGKQWFAVDLAKVKGMSGISSLLSNPVSSDPTQVLQYLRAESDSIVSEGQEQVDGVAATHYHVDLSLDRVAGALPAADRAAVQQAVSALERSTQLHHIPADVWIDGHHLVRRITMNIAAPIASGHRVNEAMTIDFVRYGVEPATAPPPAGQVANLTGLVGAGG
jgi:hypothetical protein